LAANIHRYSFYCENTPRNRQGSACLSCQKQAGTPVLPEQKYYLKNYISFAQSFHHFNFVEIIATSFFKVAIKLAEKKRFKTVPYRNHFSLILTHG
jgi:hypothetical protein